MSFETILKESEDCAWFAESLALHLKRIQATSDEDIQKEEKACAIRDCIEAIKGFSTILTYLKKE